MRRLLLVSALAVGACAPAAEAPAPSAALPELRTACAGALARLAPEAAAAAQPPLPLPSELGPTLRALSGVGMGSRVAALEVAVERAARLALRAVAPQLESAAAGFAAPRDPAESIAAAFRTAFEPELRTLLARVVPGAVAEAGANDALAAVRDGALRLPLRRAVDVDLVSAVTERAVERFFGTLADEEKRLAEEREAQRGGYGDPPNAGPLPGAAEQGGSR